MPFPNEKEPRYLGCYKSRSFLTGCHIMGPESQLSHPRSKTQEARCETRHRRIDHAPSLIRPGFGCGSARLRQAEPGGVLRPQ